MDEQLAIESIVSAAVRLDKLLWMMLLTAVAVLLVKITKGNIISAFGVNVNISYAWLVFAILTAAHAYMALTIQASAIELIDENQDHARAAWQQLRRAGPTLFYMMKARVDNTEIGGLMVYYADPSDYTFWLVLVGSMLVLLSIVDVTKKEGWLTSVMIGTTIVTINWVIGSVWAISLSSLSR